MPTLITSGRNYKIFNFNLTDAYLDITVDVTVTSFLMQAKNDNQITWRKNAAFPGEFTLKPSVAYSIDASVGAPGGSSVTIGQAKCSVAGATDTLEMWVWFT